MNEAIKTEILKENMPREKLMRHSPKILTDTELLSVLLRTGRKGENVLSLSNRLLNEYGGLVNFFSAEFERLKSTDNLGKVKAATIKACFEISLRLHTFESSAQLFIKTPKDVYNLVYAELFEQKKEQLILISLGSKNNLLSKKIISVGTVNSSLVSPREIYLEALNHGAVSIILAHNHPSHDSNPSDEDIRATKKIYLAGEMIGIPLVDHLVFGGESYTSLKSCGLIDGKGGD